MATKSGPVARPADQPEDDERPAFRASHDVAAYVAHMSAEMASMSRAAGYELLAYFLEMARIEASIQAGRVKD